LIEIPKHISMGTQNGEGVGGTFGP
jgi:hypothetical protein